ncbi:DUF1552 domain-containing protein [Lignipirellula cremea]|uniref:DUF1552 domain-containing protein n=1 Tax=Lignipirellula cremea TaxID=2528010 RepID=A0A518DLE4_9BACT|nr:DUF1552 domain-containing protein [Lignipirellula cremea]QDU92663.1 hypothetical protein Pla8534_04110 [Lignipirellula cremea]
MHLSRRNFLQVAGGAVALPWLESFGGFAHAASGSAAPQRLLLICLPLGIYREAIIPEGEGADYAAPDYLSVLEGFRDRYTVISGLDHPGVTGGHATEPRIFTGLPSHLKNSRSLDQYLATRIGRDTRYDSLVLSAGRNEYSWTDSGVMVPSQSKMSEVYAQLFVQEDRTNTERVLREINQGQSLMNLVQRQAKSLQPHLSQVDQHKLEEYFDSVVETERRLVKSESWVHTPKPQVEAPMPEDPADRSEIVAQLRNVCDVTHLAFRTDSTRVITFGYFQQQSVNIPGVQNAYHALSHHGRDPNNIAQLKRIEIKFFEELNTLLTRLQNTQEGDETLLDRTTILVTSNLGSGSSHSNKDLPVLLLGGRYNHGEHRTYAPGSTPLSNLYVSILNQFGLADKSFGASTGPLAGLEIG